MADGKWYRNHQKDLLPMVLVSEKTKWNGKKPHTQIETPPKLRLAVHPPPSFACKVLQDTYISSKKKKIKYCMLIMWLTKEIERMKALSMYVNP